MESPEKVVAELRACADEWEIAVAEEIRLFGDGTEDAIGMQAKADMYRRAADLIADQAARLEEVTQSLATAYEAKYRCNEDANHERGLRTAAEAEKERLRAAIEWALGEGDSDFGDKIPASSQRYWWRAELRRRAALSEKEQGA